MLWNEIMLEYHSVEIITFFSQYIYLPAVWKNKRITVTQNIFRQINSLFSKTVTFTKFLSNTNSLSHHTFFAKNLVKTMFLPKKILELI